MNSERDDNHVERWLQAYDRDTEVFKQLCAEVLYSIEKAIKLSGVKTHSIISRVKQRESFREKISRKHYENPIADMHDIVGARIVCLFPGDIDKIDAVLKQTFDVLLYEDKTDETAPEIWRYQSVHYDCSIKSDHQGPRYDGLQNRIFEVQVRTILQDAWATVEHYLAYKGASSIPSSLKRDFSALVGLFHVADKSFQQIHDQSLELDRKASDEVQVAEPAQKSHDDEDKVEIDRSTLKALCQKLYPSRQSSPDAAYSEFVEELTLIDVRRTDELAALLNAGNEEAEARENVYLANHKGYEPLTDTGAARLAVSISSPDFKKMLQDRRIRP